MCTLYNFASQLHEITCHLGLQRRLVSGNIHVSSLEGRPPCWLAICAKTVWQSGNCLPSCWWHSCLRPAAAKLQLLFKKSSAHPLANSLLSQSRKHSASITQLCPLQHSHPLQILLLKDLLDPPAMLAARVCQAPLSDLICVQQTVQFVSPVSPQHTLQSVWASLEVLC